MAALNIKQYLNKKYDILELFQVELCELSAFVHAEILQINNHSSGIQ